MTATQLHALADKADRLSKQLAEFGAELRASAVDQPALFEPEKPAAFNPKELALPFPSIEFQTAWHTWCDERARTRKKLTERGAAAQLKKLGTFTEAVAIGAIQKSIESGWQGLFPEKIGTPSKSFAQTDHDRFVQNMKQSAARFQHGQ